VPFKTQEEYDAQLADPEVRKRAAVAADLTAQFYSQLPVTKPYLATGFIAAVNVALIAAFGLKAYDVAAAKALINEEIDKAIEAHFKNLGKHVAEWQEEGHEPPPGVLDAIAAYEARKVVN
jgi:hypothetical protein